MRKILFITFAALLFAALPFGASAAYPEDCRLDVGAETLENLKKAEPKTAKERAARAEAELVARKELLTTLVNCSAEDALKMQLSLREMQIQDDEISYTKVQFSNRYGQVFEYYESKKRLLNDLDLANSKILAKDIKDWRAENYVPLAEETANLMLWVKNQDFFATSRRRLEQMGETVRKFNLNEDEIIAALLMDGGKDLDRADELNREAKEAIRKGDREEASGKIKESLETLSEAYKKFIELSAAVKKVIPL